MLVNFTKRFSILVLFLLGVSCKKDAPQELEGSIILNVFVVHHEIPVQEATVYLKEQATEFPGENPGAYDRNSETFESLARFTKLLPGKYWIYGEGFDGIDSVVGYMPIELADSSNFDEVDVKLHVSE